MNDKPAETMEVVAMDAPALEIMQRAEIDVQISTAKKFPRSMAVFKNRAIAMATIDEETAESCIYRRPVGKENGKPVYAEGMSVRMAEIVGASYGNLRVYATVIEQTERKVVARGMAIDMESNFASSSEVIESTVKRNGEPYDERMRVVIAKAALAKARRDATFQVVPRALARPVADAVRKVILGDAKSLAARRANAVAWISKLGVSPLRVYTALGVKGPDDLTADELEKLTGIKTAIIKDGDVSIDEAFPELEISGPAETPKEVNSPSNEVRSASVAATPQQENNAATPQDRLQRMIEEAGFTFPELIAWANESGNLNDATSFPDYASLPTVECTRWLRAKKGVLDGIKRLKGVPCN